MCKLSSEFEYVKNTIACYPDAGVVLLCFFRARRVQMHVCLTYLHPIKGLDIASLS